MTYKIIPINTGISPTSQTQVTYHPAIHEYCHAQGVDMNPCMCYLVKGEGLNLMIDLGFPQDVQCKKHFPDAVQPEGTGVVDQLKGMDVDPQAIDGIIFTHLHWDHCGYLDQFPNAQLYVQQVEYDMAMNPLPMYELIYESPRLGFDPLFRKRTFHLLHGSEQLYPGIKAYPSYGHSIGHQSVAIETNDGEYHCCGDLCFSYRNLDSIPGTGYIVSPPARFDSLSNIWNSLVTLKHNVNKSHILPTHEPAIGALWEQGKALG